VQESVCMHEVATHVTVEHGVDVLLVVALDSWGGEEEVGVGCGIAPLQVVDLGISGVPLVTKSQNQPHSIVLCSVDNVVQGLEDCLIVDTYESQNKHDAKQCGRYCIANFSGTCKAMKTAVQANCLHSADFANLHLRVESKNSGNCCVAAQQTWCRNCSKAVLTLLRLQHYCGVDAMSKHTCSGLTIVGCHRESEINRAQTKRVGGRVHERPHD